MSNLLNRKPTKKEAFIKGAGSILDIAPTVAVRSRHSTLVRDKIIARRLSNYWVRVGQYIDGSTKLYSNG